MIAAARVAAVWSLNVPTKAVIGLAQRAQRTLASLAVAAVLGAAGWAQADDAVVSTVPRLDEAAALAAGQAVIGTTPPDFTFLDRQGKPVRLSQYRGKPLLVSFIYTGCFEICPTTTRNLHEAVKGLDKLLSPNQFNVVSIGFNQPSDSPVALRSFAAQYRITYPNWEFLSPHAKIVEPLTRSFGFSYLATPAGFDHILGVTVLDGLIGDADIPRQTASADAQWVGEDGQITSSDLDFDDVQLRPKTVGAITSYSRRTLLNATPSIEQIVRAYCGEKIGLREIRKSMSCGMLKAVSYRNQAYDLLDAIHLQAMDRLREEMEKRGLIQGVQRTQAGEM